VLLPEPRRGNATSGTPSPEGAFLLMRVVVRWMEGRRCPGLEQVRQRTVGVGTGTANHGSAESQEGQVQRRALVGPRTELGPTPDGRGPAACQEMLIFRCMSGPALRLSNFQLLRRTSAQCA
jgi:hypothetical protein